jgi:hypothetical protein
MLPHDRSLSRFLRYYLAKWRIRIFFPFDSSLVFDSCFYLIRKLLIQSNAIIRELLICLVSIGTVT